MDITNFLGLLENIKPSSSGHTARCPVHDDTNNSLSISEGSDGRILVKCFAGCDIDQICSALKIEKKDLFNDTHTRRVSPPKTHAHMHTSAEDIENTDKNDVHTKVQQKHTCTVDEYSNAKKIPVAFLGRVSVTDYKHNKKHWIRISYLDENGVERTVRYRISLIGKDNFRWKTGSRVMLYGLWIEGDEYWIFLVEGESDCHTLWYHDMPAYGLPGAATWDESRDAKHFDKFKKIYIVVEPDRGGEAVKKWLAKSSIKDRAFIINLGEYKDPSGLYLSDPDNFKDNINRYMDQAKPWSDIEEQDKAQVLNEALEGCRDLAVRPYILDDFAHLVATSGLAGEVKVAKLVYLALVSRVFDRIVNIVVEGPSSGGKSFVVSKVVRFFPEEFYIEFTSMSDRALVYTDLDLQHVFIVLYEASGMSSDIGTYIIRSLLSENKIKYLVTEKDPDGKHTSRYLIKDGPTGLIFTTTAVWRHAENETRTIAISVNDTPAQTQKVLDILASDAVPEIDFTQWHALQRFIQVANYRVKIPYASQLAEKTKPVAVRLRRDFSALLSMIKAHAVLHQATRETDETGAIVATLEDYAIVLDLLGDIVAQNVELSVRGSIRETVEAVGSLILLLDLDYVTVIQVANELKLDRTSALRRLNTALKHGYLKNWESGKKDKKDKKSKEKRFVIGEPLPGDVPVFPDPSELSPPVHVCKPAKVLHAQQSTINSNVYDDVCRCAVEKEEKPGCVCSGGNGGIERCFDCEACEKNTGLCYWEAYSTAKPIDPVRCVDAIKNCPKEKAAND